MADRIARGGSRLSCLER